MAIEPDTLILLRLLATHLAADFLFQPLRWIEGRRRKGIRSRYIYYHIAIVGFLTWLFLADWTEVLLPLFIMVTHFGIDWWKSSRPKRLKNFVIDQSAHLLMLLAGWTVYANTLSEITNYAGVVFSHSPFWIVLVSYVTAIWPCGYFISEVTRRWQDELTPEDDPNGFGGLRNAGMWIGSVERFIILTFILLGQYGAIGFLIAAKSVFRFSGKLEDHRARKETEYILIGTLLSFALAIVIGIGAEYLLAVMG